MASKKVGHLGSEITLLQCGFAKESVAGVNSFASRRLRSNISAKISDLAATLFSKSLSDARREMGGGTVSLAIFFTKRSGPKNGAPSPGCPLLPVIHFPSIPDKRFLTSNRSQFSHHWSGVDQSALSFPEVVCNVTAGYLSGKLNVQTS
jgi:hypothetical protein